LSIREENTDWGAPKIHGEMLKLGFAVSERTVARYLRRIQRRGDPSKKWLAFLQNHKGVIVAFDFFTVPTLTFQLLYCFFVIEHGAAGSYISTSLDIRVRSGSCNNCARPFRKLAHTVT
jgi:hypothetical protein